MLEQTRGQSWGALGCLFSPPYIGFYMYIWVTVMTRSWVQNPPGSDWTIWLGLIRDWTVSYCSKMRKITTTLYSMAHIWYMPPTSLLWNLTGTDFWYNYGLPTMWTFSRIACHNTFQYSPPWATTFQPLRGVCFPLSIRSLWGVNVHIPTVGPGSGFGGQIQLTCVQPTLGCTHSTGAWDCVLHVTA